MTDSDDSFFATPCLKVKPTPMYEPGELLFELQSDQSLVRCELRIHDEQGFETQIFLDGELTLGRRFATRELAEQWATIVRADIERGGCDARSRSSESNLSVTRVSVLAPA